jgi:hypothetical protein
MVAKMSRGATGTAVVVGGAQRVVVDVDGKTADVSVARSVAVVRVRVVEVVLSVAVVVAVSVLVKDRTCVVVTEAVLGERKVPQKLLAWPLSSSRHPEGRKRLLQRPSRMLRALDRHLSSQERLGAADVSQTRATAVVRMDGRALRGWPGVRERMTGVRE